MYQTNIAFIYYTFFSVWYCPLSDIQLDNMRLSGPSGRKTIIVYGWILLEIWIFFLRMSPCFSMVLTWLNCVIAIRLGKLQCLYVSGSKLLILGMVIRPLIANTYNGYRKPLLLGWWVYPWTHGTKGSLDPTTYKQPIETKGIWGQIPFLNHDVTSPIPHRLVGSCRFMFRKALL